MKTSTPSTTKARRALSVLSLAVGLSIAATSQLSAQTIINGGFANTNSLTGPNSNDFYYAGVTGWNLSSSSNSAWVELFTPSSGGIGHAYNIVPALTTSIPGGGNMVTFDTSIASYSNTSLYQTITGLTVGQQYSINFSQALSQQVNNNWASPVSGHWLVSMTDPTNPTGPALSGQTFNSNTMYANNATGLYTPWQTQSFVFTASKSSETLNFLSVGSGEPPDLSLANVSLSVVTVPEPNGALLVGVAGFLMIFRRRTQSRR